MDRELARKLPVPVVTNRLTLTYPDHRSMRVDLARRVRAGEIARTGRVTQRGLEWIVNVDLIPRAKPRWWQHWSWKVALGLAGTTALLATLYVVLKLLVVALVAFLPYLGAGLVLMALVAIASGGRVVEVVQKVRIKG